MDRPESSITILDTAREFSTPLFQTEEEIKEELLKALRKAISNKTITEIEEHGDYQYYLFRYTSEDEQSYTSFTMKGIL